jgi:homoserine dehydrogenase
MSKRLSIAVAGLGTVGAGLIRLLDVEREIIAARGGGQLDVVAVSARERNRDRGVSIDRYRWFDDAVQMATADGIDVVVELIGGADGPAKAVVEAALNAGRHVVTANKALLAHHGAELAKLAESKGVSLGFEAAVAGGIPVIKALREGLAANEVSEVYGILNGTCNYILTEMADTGAPFDSILEAAQKLGYAEADPSTDVDGFDAAHKLSLLASLAFARPVDFAGVKIEGIRSISPLDIRFAKELGYRIKLLGHAKRTNGAISQTVRPCLVHEDLPIASVDGVLNGVVIRGSFVQDVLLVGRGAGGGPTASAVAADLIDIARDLRPPVFGVPAEQLDSSAPETADESRGAYYLRLLVRDKPGVFADIAAILRDEGISIETVVQRGHEPDEAVPVILTTHPATGERMRAALASISALDSVLEQPQLLPVMAFN